MAYYYLKDENTGATYTLDTTVVSVTLPTMSRQFSVQDTYSDGANVNGSGAYKANVITVSRTFKKNGSGTAWNSLRYAFMAWIGQPKNNVLWFYVEDGTNVLRVQVYPIAKGQEQYRSLSISGEIPFTFQMVKAYFEKTTASTTSATLTGTTMQSVAVTNSGVIRTPPVITLVPTANFTLFQVQLSTNYGFRLEGTFLSGHTYVYDCRTAIFTDNGIQVTGALTRGSLFALDPGSNTLNVWATTTGANGFTVSWYERYI